MSTQYEVHILRMPADQWPDPVKRAFKHMSTARSTCRCRGRASSARAARSSTGTARATWRSITVPTLIIGARYDTMDPTHMEWMAKTVQHGRYLYCPNGSHLALYDDQQRYFTGLVRFLADVDAGRLAAAPAH